MSAPVIVLAAVRNELHNLRTVIPSWKAFAQHIVLCDQQSEDGTLEWIKEQHPDVLVVNNDGADYDERSRGQILIETCRSKFGIGNVLLYLDADETLSSQVFTSVEWQTFCNAAPGTAGEFPWVNFWFSPKYYLWQGPFGSLSYNRVAFIDDGRPIASANEMHGMRGPGGDAHTVCYFTELSLLHYGYVPLVKNVFKQTWYKVWWRAKGGKNFHTNRNHNYYHMVRMHHTLPSPENWFSGYRERGIDVETLFYPALPWHGLDVLRRMTQHGEALFHGLDIWSEVNWEQLRKAALKAGHTEIKQEPIVLPPKYKRLSIEFSRGPGALGRLYRSGTRYLMRKILP